MPVKKKVKKKIVKRKKVKATMWAVAKPSGLLLRFYPPDTLRSEIEETFICDHMKGFKDYESAKNHFELNGLKIIKVKVSEL